MKAWLEQKPELRIKLPDIHTSGHADIASLQKIVAHIQPKHIIPIHTELPEKFGAIFPDYNVVNANDGTPMNLTNVDENL